MRDGGYLSLADVTQMVLVARGAEVLSDARLFQGYVMDYMDPESTECRVVERYAGAGMLVPYVEVAGAVAPDLKVACARVLSYLRDECFVNEDAASLVADGIAVGVARWRGIVWDSAFYDTTVKSTPPAGSDGGPDDGARDEEGRLIPTAGLFVDAKGRVHLCALRVGASAKEARYVTDVTDWRGAKPRLARLMGRQLGQPVDVFAAASDLDFARYVGMVGILRDAGIDVVRWCLPTDALCTFCYGRVHSLESYLVLAVYVGVKRCTVGLYECADGVQECLGTARGNLSDDYAERCSAVGRLVASLKGELEGMMSSPDKPSGMLRVCLANEEGRRDGLEGEIWASLSKMGVSLGRVEFVAAGSIDVTRGLVARASVLSGVMAFGDALPFLPLDAIWFDVLLQGQRKSVKVIDCDTTIPTSNSQVLDCRSDGDDASDPAGPLRGLVVAERNGKGLRFPLPDEARALGGNDPDDIEATVDIEPGYRVRLTIKNRTTGKTLQYLMKDFLDKAVPVTVARRVLRANMRREDGTAQASSAQGEASGGAGVSSRATDSAKPTAKGTSSTDASSTEDDKGKSSMRYVLLVVGLFLAACLIAYGLSSKGTYSSESNTSAGSAASSETIEKGTEKSDTEKDAAKDKKSKKSKEVTEEKTDESAADEAC